MLQGLGSCQEDWDEVHRVHAASGAARESIWDVEEDDEEVPLQPLVRSIEGDRHVKPKPSLWQMLQTPVQAAELKLGEHQSGSSQ